ncbi:hypothetical protein [Streptomyces mexicanus]|uniref:hypothetical protein n=1 Tax=Streptomyces mexicanus TaxID=178566 RepID=UPI0036BB2DA2
MREVVRATALTGLAVGLLALAGCGVPPTGVIDAGAPASGIPARTTVYFLAGTALRGVPRPTADGTDPVAGAVALLLAGPTRAEARQHLTTDLPEVSAGVRVTSDGDTVTVRLPPGVGRLTDRGVEQLACTAAHARRSVASRGPDGPAASPTGRPDAFAAGGAPRPVRGAARISVRVVGATWDTVRTVSLCPSG